MSKIISGDKSKGGSVTKSYAVWRQSQVEKLMLEGKTLTQIANTEVNGKHLGAITTISKDMYIIRSRWLDQDPEWFHRASVARIEAAQQLRAQFRRLNIMISEIQDGKYDTILKNTKDEVEQVTTKEERPRKLAFAESQLTKIITHLYAIDADFDPEQYLDHRITESMKHKM